MREIRSLTGIRGIAAALVVCYHTMWVSTFKAGYLAVDMFFILSGFIMMAVYYAKFNSKVTASEYNKFMWNRFARIYPVYILITVINIIVFYFQGNPFEIKRVIVNAALTQSLGLSDSIIGPSWSISVEFLAYLTFPFVALATIKSIWARVAVMVLIVQFYTQLATTPLYTKYGILNVSQYYLNGPVIRGFCGFYLGVIIFFFKDSLPLMGKKLTSLLQILAFGGIVYCLTDKNLAMYYIALCSILILALYANDEGIVSRFLSCGPIHYLGKISLSLYLVHLLVVMAVNPIKFRYPLYIFNPKVDPGVIVLLLSIAVSALLYKYVELPAREYLKRKFSG